MSINLSPNILNTSFLRPLNFSQYFTIRGKPGYTAWLNYSYHTPLFFNSKLFLAVLVKAWHLSCLLSVWGLGDILRKKSRPTKWEPTAQEVVPRKKILWNQFSPLPPRERVFKKKKKSVCTYEMGTFMKDDLDVRNLPFSNLNENSCKHDNVWKKSELIDANSPLGHLEFNSILRYFQLKWTFIET